MIQLYVVTDERMNFRFRLDLVFSQFWLNLIWLVILKSIKIELAQNSIWLTEWSTLLAVAWNYAVDHCWIPKFHKYGQKTRKYLEVWEMKKKLSLVVNLLHR